MIREGSNVCPALIKYLSGSCTKKYSNTIAIVWLKSKQDS